MWERALELAFGPAPALPAGLVQRVFHPGNVLWRRRQVTGVVDWQAASVGPSVVDVAHCRSNLLAFDRSVADRFTAIWSQVSGAKFHPWADVVTIVGFLDDPRSGWGSERHVLEGVLPTPSPNSTEGLDSVPRYRVYPAFMRSSQVAARAGVNVQTLRYYERRGLLPLPERSDSDYRAYDAQTVRTVRFVKNAEQLGFTLEEIDSLLHLAAGGPRNCDTAKDLATDKLGQFEQKIASLTAMRDSLRQLIATCERAPSKRVCPLLDALAEPAPTEDRDHE